MKEINYFMGFKLPKNISYEVFSNYVQFYRKNSLDEWLQIGYIVKSYSVQPLKYWKTELDKVLREKTLTI